MLRVTLPCSMLAIALVACGDKDATGSSVDSGATGGDTDTDTDTDTDPEPGTGGGTGGDAGGGGGTGGDAGGGGGGGGGGTGGAGGGDAGGGEGGQDESRDLSAYAGDWSGEFTMAAVATDGSGVSDSCSGVLTFSVDPAETSGPPILGAFTCSWAGPLTELESQVDSVFAGGTPGLPAVEGVIIYGPFEPAWTGTATASEWSGTLSGTYVYDPSIPQLPGVDISGSWSASPVTR